MHPQETWKDHHVAGRHVSDRWPDQRLQAPSGGGGFAVLGLSLSPGVPQCQQPPPYGQGPVLPTLQRYRIPGLEMSWKLHDPKRKCDWECGICLLQCCRKRTPPSRAPLACSLISSQTPPHPSPVQVLEINMLLNNALHLTSLNITHFPWFTGFCYYVFFILHKTFA